MSENESGFFLWTTLIMLSIFVVLKLVNFFTTIKISQKEAFVVVLGDLGRSPRMNYHSLSLAKLGYQVKMIGYAGKRLEKQKFIIRNIIGTNY